MRERLTKSATDRVIDGIAGGVAEYFGIDALVIRIVFLLLLITTGGGFGLVYIALMFLMPPPAGVVEEPNIVQREARRRQLGVLMVLLGVGLLLNRLLHLDAEFIAGTLIIGLGLWLLARRREPLG